MCVLPIHTTGLSVLQQTEEVCYLQKVSFSGTGGKRVFFFCPITRNPAHEGENSDVCFHCYTDT